MKIQFNHIRISNLQILKHCSQLARKGVKTLSQFPHKIPIDHYSHTKMLLSIENEIFRRGLPEKLRVLDLSQLFPQLRLKKTFKNPSWLTFFASVSSLVDLQK